MGETVVRAIAIPATEEWKRLILPSLARALEYAEGEITAEQLFERASKGLAQLWLVADANMGILGVAGTEVVEYPGYSALRVIALAGTGFDTWGDRLLNELLSYAHRYGLVRIEACGRRGLERLLAPLGFKQKYIVITREVDNGQDSGNDERDGYDGAASRAAEVS